MAVDLRLTPDQLLSSTKKGKQVLNVAPDEKALTCIFVEGDSVAVVGENRKLIYFPDRSTSHNESAVV